MSFLEIQSPMGTWDLISGGLQNIKSEKKLQSMAPVMKNLSKTAIQARCMIAFFFVSPLLADSPTPTASPNLLSRILYKQCNSATNPNANALINSLVKGAPLGGFNISIQGHGSDKLFGILECRGDLSQKHCATCSSTVAAELQNKCGNASSAWIHLEGCYLRYDNYPFFWQSHDFSELFHQCGEDSLSGTDFSQVLQDVIYKAPIYGGFSAATGSGETYALAQCNAYVNPYDCGVCLRLALYFLEFDCVNLNYMVYVEQDDSQVLLDSCFLRFQQHKFFEREQKGAWWNIRFPSAPPQRINKLAVGITCGALGAAIILLCSLGVCIKIKARRKSVQIHCIVEDGEIPRLSDESTIVANTNHGMPNS
eukprot:Gb_18789 [translate_table: standard]